MPALWLEENLIINRRSWKLSVWDNPRLRLGSDALARTLWRGVPLPRAPPDRAIQARRGVDGRVQSRADVA